MAGVAIADAVRDPAHDRQRYLFDRAREEGLIDRRHDSAYQNTYTGKTHLLESRYLDIWLRVVLKVRKVGVPTGALHHLIDMITNR